MFLKINKEKSLKYSCKSLSKKCFVFILLAGNFQNCKENDESNHLKWPLVVKIGTRNKRLTETCPKQWCGILSQLFVSKSANI